MSTTTTTSPTRTRPPAPWQLPSQLAELSDAGLVASVYLGTRGDIRGGVEAVASRWRQQRHRLRSNGTPEAVLSALDECTRLAPVDGGTLVAFATDDGRSHVEHLSRSLGSDRASVGPVPHVLPLLTARHREVPAVVVGVDRLGADMLLLEPGVQDLLCQVIGEDLLITGSALGTGPRRCIEQVEEQGATRARAISDALTWLVDSSRARLVVAGGDHRLLGLVRSELEPRVDALLTEVPDPCRAADQLAGRARAMAADVTALDEQAVVDELLTGLADGRACLGPASALRAVLDGEAEEVLIAPDEVDRHGLPWRLLRAAPVARLHRDDAAAPPAGGALLSDVLVRAAGTTSAVVRTIRDGRRLDGGVGVLLRRRTRRRSEHLRPGRRVLA